MRIHLIAIGGAIMHQIALTSQRKGHIVTGSDDVIQEPSRSRLKEAGILPEKEGFFAENISSNIDLVILGMHAKFDNPELARAMELGLRVLSFPEYIYENSRDKKRVVIAGSHGKTSITSMIMHVLKYQQIDFDYMVGSSVAGFNYSVRLSDAPIIVIEGDEYLASPINKEPKFIYYKANIATISGIEWDHINVFPTEEIYDEQFKKLILSMDENAKLYYYQDEKIKSIVENVREDVELIPYHSIKYEVIDEQFYAIANDKRYPLEIIGKHNMENVQAAYNVCLDLGVSEEGFWNAISTFNGAGRRLEKLVDTEQRVVYKDFAHSPSKLRATIQAVKENYKHRHVVACFEMHTYSTLTEAFLPQYAHSMDAADTAIIFIDKQVIEKKGTAIFDETLIKKSFQRDDIIYITDIKLLENVLTQYKDKKPVYLMMSSGTFGGMDLKNIGNPSFATPVHMPIIPDENIQQTTYKIEPPSLEDKQKLMAIYGLSYMFFIIPSLVGYLYFKNKTTSANFEKSLLQLLNFQLIATLIFCTTLYANQHSFLPLYWAGWLFNIIYLSQAIRKLYFGISVALPAIDIVKPR